MNPINVSASQAQPRASLGASVAPVEKKVKYLDPQKASTSSSNIQVDKSLALSQTEVLQLKKLQAIDKRVRAHEQAHLSAAGSIAKGGASFKTATGADGKQYAVAGEVSIDTSKIPGDPQATLVKARQIRRAAQAPAAPSAQDRLVATAAYAMEQQALVELRQLKSEQIPSTNGEAKTDPEQETSSTGIDEVA